MPTYAVLGASGYIGRHLVAALHQRPDTEIRLYGRTAGMVEGRPVAPLAGEDPFDGVDVVIHVAGLAHRRASDAAFREANADFPALVAEHAARSGVRRMVMLSSVAVHGRWSDRPLGPDNPFAPVNAYGASKAAGEQAVVARAERTGLEWTTVRAPMVYGAHAPGNFSALVGAVSRGVPLPLGRACGLRSLVSIGNLTDALLFCARDPNAANRIMLPADVDDIRARDLIRLIAAQVGREAPRLWPAPAPVMRAALGAVGRGAMYDSLYRDMTVDRAHWAALGWAPRETVAAGVARALPAS
jgi:nucleoside-diphosphate-sugar epimerase